MSVRVFWFHHLQNFGDALAPVLVRRFSGLEPVWSRPATSEAVVIGSIAGRLPRRYYGVVIGIGKIDENVSVDLSRAQVLSLRGELTLRGSGVRGDVVLGDPGLLAAELLTTRPPVIHPLGVVAHYADPHLAAKHSDAHHISIDLDPVEFVTQVASCERIISSSLHGLITSDALGIPRCWAFSNRVVGEGFKFMDYASALGMTLTVDTWGEAPRSAVDAAVRQLRDVFRALPDALTSPKPVLWRVAQIADAAAGRVTRHR